MNAIDLKRAEFRQYLESTGVMEALSYALIKLYDENVKPTDPVKFVRKHFKRPNDEIDSVDSAKRIEDLDAAELIQKQKTELEMARQEIAKLRQTLNTMADHSSQIDCMENVDDDDGEMVSFQNIFDDLKYDTTLVKKYLTENLFESFTEIGDKPSIVDCIVKVNALESYPLGIIALNGDCYTKFAELFDPIIKEVHGIDGDIKHHPDTNWGDGNVFKSLNSDNIISIEINCSRSLAGVPFIPGMNVQDLENVLITVQNAIQTRTDDQEIDGEFYKITDVKENEPIFDDLQRTGLGFRSMNPNDHRLWPTGRSLYVNCARTQSILINEEEHLRFVCKEATNDFGLVYRNLLALMQRFGDGLKFERNEKLGCLTTNIRGLGAGLQFHIRIKIIGDIKSVKEICQKYQIEVKFIKSNEAENEQIVEFTKQSTIGCSEFDCMHLFYDQMKEIIELLSEKSAEAEPADENSESVVDKTVEEAEKQEEEHVDDKLSEENALENPKEENHAPDSPSQDKLNGENIEAPETNVDNSVEQPQSDPVNEEIIVQPDNTDNNDATTEPAIDFEAPNNEQKQTTETENNENPDQNDVANEPKSQSPPNEPES